MRATLVAGAFLLVVSSGCPAEKPKPVMRTLEAGTLCEHMSPLNDAEVHALGLPAGFAEFLPLGIQTPAGLVTDPSDASAPIGFGFVVRTGAAQLTAHAIRRELSLLAKPKSLATPVALVAPADDSDKRCVLVLQGQVQSDTELALSGPSHHEARRTKVAHLLDDWKRRASLDVAALGPDWVEIEIDAVKERDVDDLASDLLGALHDPSLDEDDVAAMIDRHATIRLPI